MADREYDLIVFGASGFTGQYVALEVSKTSKEDGKTWAVAGRSSQKLEKVLNNIKTEIGDELNEVGIITADTSDDQSLFEMCKKGRIVLNCVGPYRFYGEPVVKACVKAKTNYVDVSGEPEFLETMQLKYHDDAEAAGIHIVGACGFDSIPSDCGVEHLRDKFDGDLTAVESYLKYHGRMKGNFGTYESIIHGLLSSGNLKDIRKRLMPEKMKYAGPKLQKRGTVFHSKQENQWSLLFMGADPSVVRRTQYHEQQKSGQSPIQYGAYFCMKNLLELIGLFIFGLFLGILAPFKCGRYLLKKYPKFFTLGSFSKEGLTRQEMSERSFSMIFYGRGYSPDSDKTGKPDSALGLKIHGPEPGYVATPIFMVQAALTILEGKLPNRGGVLTPGAAFCKTSLINRLMKSGIEISTFKVDVKDL
eukprot:Seg2875.2 transcript_id=Seg2875.2/GoldUCD/mRNA.D3Y31 product="Saccharopine dehydrogenase-like oxidoreductase" protein_id=Seg2875.2/GoldUCD/D3Y31